MTEELCVVVRGVISQKDCPKHPAYVSVIAPTVKEAKQYINDFFKGLNAYKDLPELPKISFFPIKVIACSISKTEEIGFNFCTQKDDGTYTSTGYASERWTDTYPSLSLVECFE